MNARQRIDFIADTGSFCEMDADLRAKDVIHFPGYDKKLKHARLASGEKGGCCLRHSCHWRGKLRFICNGAFFYDGKHGNRCGRKGHPLV